MNLAVEALANKKIKEIVYDEEKDITCVSLANELNVTVDKAKAFLTAFVADPHKSKLEDVHAIYMLSGSLKDGTGVAIYLVTQNDLLSKRALFDSVSEEFVYSIQKKQNVNIVLLNDNFEFFNFFENAIASKNCAKRNIKSTKKRFLKKNQVNAEIKDVQKMFQDFKGSQDNQLKTNQASSIKSYFTKGLSKSSRESVNVAENADLVKSATRNVMGSEGSLNESDKKITIVKENLKCKKEDDSIAKANVKAEDANKKRKNDNKSDNICNKKRKRIQEICDSDNSDIFDEETDNDIIEKSDEEDIADSEEQIMAPKKVKNRKAVDEVHMDDDGYMVTTTKYIYESESEDTDEQKDKNNSKKKSDVLTENKNCSTNLDNDKVYNSKNKNKKKSGKQTTLINFFKKH